MFRSGIALAILLILSFFLSSCATILNGGEQEVSVSSSPSEAEVTIKSNKGVVVFTGRSPVVTKLSRKNSYEVKVELEGYKESTVWINNNFNMTYLGNILCGGVVGFIVDPITGAMWKLEPDEINISLAVALNNESNNKETYITFRYLDDENRLRTLYVPLIKA